MTEPEGCQITPGKRRTTGSAEAASTFGAGPMPRTIASTDDSSAVTATGGASVTQ